MASKKTRQQRINEEKAAEKLAEKEYWAKYKNKSAFGKAGDDLFRYGKQLKGFLGHDVNGVSDRELMGLPKKGSAADEKRIAERKAKHRKDLELQAKSWDDNKATEARKALAVLDRTESRNEKRRQKKAVTSSLAKSKGTQDFMKKITDNAVSKYKKDNNITNDAKPVVKPIPKPKPKPAPKKKVKSVDANTSAFVPKQANLKLDKMPKTTFKKKETKGIQYDGKKASAQGKRDANAANKRNSERKVMLKGKKDKQELTDKNIIGSHKNAGDEINTGLKNIEKKRNAATAKAYKKLKDTERSKNRRPTAKPYNEGYANDEVAYNNELARTQAKVEKRWEDDINAAGSAFNTDLAGRSRVRRGQDPLPRAAGPDMPLSYDPETIGTKAKLYGMYGDEGVAMYDKAIDNKVMGNYLDEESFQDPAYDTQGPVDTTSLVNRQTVGPQGRVIQPPLDQIPDEEYVAQDPYAQAPIGTNGIPQGTEMSPEEIAAMPASNLADNYGNNVIPEEVVDPIYEDRFGVKYLNKALYDKKMAGMNAFEKAKYDTINTYKQEKALGNYDRLADEAQKALEEVAGVDANGFSPEDEVTDVKIGKRKSKAKVNPKTGKNTVKIDKTPYMPKTTTKTSKPRTNKRVVQSAPPPAVAKHTLNPVQASAKRYATVDPLNLFGNRNGINPFASNGEAVTNDRFSGGKVPDRVITNF